MFWCLQPVHPFRVPLAIVTCVKQHRMESITNSMEHNSSWEAINCFTSQIRRLLLKPKLHWRLNKSPPSTSLPWATLLQSMSLHSFYLRTSSILFFHLRLGSPNCLFRSGFQTEIDVLFKVVLYSLPSHPLGLIALIIFCKLLITNHLYTKLQTLTQIQIRIKITSVHYINSNFNFNLYLKLCIKMVCN
jgi:hypothetical protein